MNKILQNLISKAENLYGKPRMPSIVNIHKLLVELNIEHDFYTSTNVVEHSSKGNTYVNDRYNGKRGYILEINDIVYMDTSDSYYSWNSSNYAFKIVEYLKKIDKLK